MSSSENRSERVTIRLEPALRKDLEDIANSYEGVDNSYVIQAGREVRIIVKPEQIDDLSAQQLSRKIAKRVEKELDYPGQVKVNVIRETRAIEFAE